MDLSDIFNDLRTVTDSKELAFFILITIFLFLFFFKAYSKKLDQKTYFKQDNKETLVKLVKFRFLVEEYREQIEKNSMDKDEKFNQIKDKIPTIYPYVSETLGKKILHINQENIEIDSLIKSIDHEIEFIESQVENHFGYFSNFLLASVSSIIPVALIITPSILIYKVAFRDETTLEMILKTANISIFLAVTILFIKSIPKIQKRKEEKTKNSGTHVERKEEKTKDSGTHVERKEEKTKDSGTHVERKEEKTKDFITIIDFVTCMRIALVVIFICIFSGLYPSAVLILLLTIGCLILQRIW